MQDRWRIYTELERLAYEEDDMKHFTIKRINSDIDGTFGVLLEHEKGRDINFALTVEKEWHDNEPFLSCIPTGLYVCMRVISPKWGETFEITDVENRSHILFHIANTEDDLSGCIGIGEQFEFLNGKIAVLSSKRGYTEFMNRCDNVDEFLLTIMET